MTIWHYPEERPELYNTIVVLSRHNHIFEFIRLGKDEWHKFGADRYISDWKNLSMTLAKRWAYLSDFVVIDQILEDAKQGKIE